MGILKAALAVLVLALFSAVCSRASASFVDSASTTVLLLLIAAVVPVVVLLPRICGAAIKSALSLKWWQVLWLLLFVSGLVFRGRDSAAIEDNPVDAWAMLRIGLVGLTALVLIFRWGTARTAWPGRLTHGIPAVLALYCLVCLASSLWSVFPAWTLYKSLEFFVDVATMAAILATLQSAVEYKALFDWTWTLLILLLASIWVGAVLWPANALLPNEGLLGFQLAGAVPYLDSNSVGELGAVLCVIAACRFSQAGGQRLARISYAILFMAALATMCLAQGRSGILACAVAMLILLLLSGHFATAASLALSACMALSVGNAWNTLVTFMRRGENDEDFHSLSGRTDWWSFAWPKVMQHPFAGYGAYAGGRFFVMAEYRIDTGIHSDWLEIVLGTGFCGLILALAALFGAWRCLLTAVKDSTLPALERRLAMEAIGVLSVLSVRSIFSPALYLHPPVVFFAAFALGEFLRMRQAHMSTVNAHASAKQFQGIPSGIFTDIDKSYT